MSTELDLLLIRSGITYRQLDWWTRKGYIEPRFRRRNGDAVDHSRSGYVRDFSDQEQRVILRMGRLTGIGLKAEQAAVAARSMVDRDEDWVRLDGGVTVTLDLQGADDWAHPTEQHIMTVEDGTDGEERQHTERQATGDNPGDPGAAEDRGGRAAGAGPPDGQGVVVLDGSADLPDTPSDKTVGWTA